MLTDALESMFGKLKWMANQNNGFGALSFTRVLRNYILGEYRDIMSCKKSAMSAVDLANSSQATL